MILRIILRGGEIEGGGGGGAFFECLEEEGGGARKPWILLSTTSFPFIWMRGGRGRGRGGDLFIATWARKKKENMRGEVTLEDSVDYFEGDSPGVAGRGGMRRALRKLR